MVGVDHPFLVDIFNNPATATQCRKQIGGYRYCPIPRGEHPGTPPTETERRAADPDSPSVESTDKEAAYRPSPSNMACGRGDHRAETSERQRARRAAATQQPHAPATT